MFLELIAVTICVSSCLSMLNCLSDHTFEHNHQIYCFSGRHRIGIELVHNGYVFAKKNSDMIFTKRQPL